MSRKRQPVKAMIRIFQKVSGKFFKDIKKQFIWLLRAIFNINSRREAPNSGFILPTVAMVSIVVVLLTLAIMFRSFDRAKNASNVRVNEAVVNAATPAIDRARAKISKLFNDSRLPRAVPGDASLYQVIAGTTADTNAYTFGDETPLTLSAGGSTLNTAWRYPVDTDNNGKFDSYTLYGIYFRTPPVVNGQYSRARNSLESRTPPMNAGSSTNPLCGEGTSAILVGNSGWVKDGSKLKKSFFVYTATVPITTDPSDSTNYEKYKGNKGFSAIEYQQDRVQLPPTNNAVVYEDDLEITLGSTPLALNGRIITNANLLTGAESIGQGKSYGVKFFQVSAPASCFYEAENAKVIVGGNTSGGKFTNIKSGDGTAGAKVYGDLAVTTKADLFQGNSVTTVDWQKSVTETDNRKIAYNNLAYTQRINRLVEAQFANSTDPPLVVSAIEAAKTKLGQNSYTADEEATIRRQQLEIYFKKRTRRVPFAEVASFVVADALGSYSSTTPLTGSGDNLRPVDTWAFPTEPSDGKTATNYTKLSLNISGTTLIPSGTEPTKLTQAPYNGNEQGLGDRTLIGNNLPGLWYKGTAMVGPNATDTQDISGINWDLPVTPTQTRTRRSRVQVLADLGSTDRDGDWELAASQSPSSAQENVGGLRVVTGAGIYLPASYASGVIGSTVTNIWSDQRWVNPPATATTLNPNPYAVYDPSITFTSPVRGNTTPYLRMRATAVYHYKSGSTPIACVSSYYDPTDANTARNTNSFTKLDGTTVNLSDAKYDVSPYVPTGATPQGARTGGNSNNGIVYGPPTGTVTTYQTILDYQKTLKYPATTQYPNGRLIDDGILAKALGKAAGDRTLSEKSAIDAQMCALQILDGTITPIADAASFTDGKINHGTILEAAFLDSRQIKQISTDPTSRSYDLPLRDRQPLEIRATVLNIDSLRQEIIGSYSPTEYMLPNSGIIYATRDDALPDLSSALTGVAQKLESPVDYKLDPTRRPNGIMLVNGRKVFRGSTNTFRDAEKGLILASNLPAYIMGNFNVHENADGTQQEFTTAVDDTWSNFYTRSTLNPYFACRPNDPRLPQCGTDTTKGDYWRPVSVLADAVTLLSDNFRTGFRSEGDYDWNNNLGDSAAATRPNNFQYNTYVPKFTWYKSDLFPLINLEDTTNTTSSRGSSYLNNFVTPIVRRVPTPALANEVCVPNSRTQTVGDIVNGTGTLPYALADGTAAGTACRWTLTTGGSGSGIASRYNVGQDSPNTGTGTLVQPVGSDYSGLPTRIAYIRNDDGTLATPLQVFGISESTNKTAIFTVDDNFLFSSANGVKKSTTTMPWLKATIDPLNSSKLVFTPVLQIERPFALDDTTTLILRENHKNWLQVVNATTEFNLIIAAGDTPARPEEDNGGLHNFPRFMEHWSPTGSATIRKAKISGSFIQYKKSAYATGPFSTSLTSQGDDFLYRISLNNGRASGYQAPDRQWGYDVGLLSQAPDLFAQKLVITPSDSPDEYFREVGRDDGWVKTLLCAKTTATGTPNAIDTDQRGTCP